MRKWPASLYHEDSETKYLAIYNYHPDTYLAEPPSIADKLTRVAQVEYGFGGRKRGISIFQIRGSLPKDVDELRIDRNISLEQADKRLLQKTDTKQGIKYHLKIMPQGQEQNLMNLARLDIRTFAKKPAKDQSTQVNTGRVIIPKTKAEKRSYENPLTWGKQVYVPSCLFERNIDFSLGCIAGFIPLSGATFDQTTFTNWIKDPWKECSYCYAGYLHKDFSKSLLDLNKNQLTKLLNRAVPVTYDNPRPLGRPVKVLRIGKRSECGSRVTRRELIATLEACVESGTRTVMPTKILEFNSELKRLFKKTNSSLLYSIGWDEFEPGIVAHGCSNNWRLEQAIEYKQAGLNPIVYLGIIAFSPITHREKQVLQLAEKHKLRVQLLPVRFGGKDLCFQMTGYEWDYLKDNSPEALFADPEQIKGTCYTKAGVLIPEKIHQDWLNLIGNNNRRIRMCHHNLETTWCGSCFLQKGTITQTKDVKAKKRTTTRRGKIKKERKIDTTFFN